MASTPFREGDIIANKYRVDRVLGEGGMGVVLAATHRQLEQKVALKFLLPAFVSKPDVVERFLREGRAAAKVQSEHVARVLDVDATSEGTPYLVMEFLQGEDLAQLLTRTGALPIEDSVGYVLEACEAIAEAHAGGIVHRDLKPANLFLAQRAHGRPIIKVLDFGISKVSSTASSDLTKTSGLLGSPFYMSPEQLVAAATVDARSDVWALGVVLYEMLAGTTPFDGETLPELVGAILMKPYPPLHTRRPDAPPGLSAAVDACLQKDPARRIQNVAALADAIAPFAPLRGRQSVDRIAHVLGVRVTAPPESVPRVEAAASPVLTATFSPTTSQPAPPPREAPRSPLRFVLPPLGALALIGVAFGTVGLIRGRARTPDHAPTVAASSVPSSSPVPLEMPTASSAPSAPAPSTAEPVAKPPPTAKPSVPALPSTPPPAPSASASAGPRPCRIVPTYDPDGTAHFKKECP